MQQPRPILPITAPQPAPAKIHLGRLARAMVPKRLASARETRVTTPARRPRRTSALQQRASNQRDFNQVRDHVFSSLWAGGAGGPLLKRIVDLKGAGDYEILRGDSRGSGCRLGVR